LPIALEMPPQVRHRSDPLLPVQGIVKKPESEELHTRPVRLGKPIPESTFSRNVSYAAPERC
jgi:hypothetical protein